jgi:hypothetical protein
MLIIGVLQKDPLKRWTLPLIKNHFWEIPHTNQPKLALNDFADKSGMDHFLAKLYQKEIENDLNTSGYFYSKAYNSLKRWF